MKPAPKDALRVRNQLPDPSHIRTDHWHTRQLTIKHGEFEICERGVLVKPGDVEGFAHGLQYLLEHPDLGNKMGQKGREYAQKYHGKENLVADVDRLYRALVAG